MHLSWWSVIPFVLMLGSIAVFPLIPATAHWWEKERSQLLVALILGVPVAVWIGLTASWWPVADTAVEYFQFICLLASLFIVSGGFFVAGDLIGNPRNNTIFLAIGGALASFVGTTGAAMLLVRPLLNTNSERRYRVHTMLFTIFIVANCGGLLTPLGDPPLFLGMLRGVPFTWTFSLFPQWLFVNGLMLLSYYALDSYYWAKEPDAAVKDDYEHVTPLGFHGKIQIFFFACIIASVAFLPSINVAAIEEGHANIMQWIPWREVVMIAAATASYMLGDKKTRFEDNQFTWGPIKEVATLFIGIFLTMIPALEYLAEIAPKLPLTESTFFIFTGGLSSVLDNAPTYATFFEMATQLPADGMATVAGVPEHYLTAISLGAVLCGALTYIGNGPNFMVKSVAESAGVEMPAFGRYIVDAAFLLLPAIVAMVLFFIASGWVSNLLGAIVTAVVLARCVVLLILARRSAGAEPSPEIRKM
ncbi:sodium:proton antiporter [Actinomyces vulturis]|uniref:sodium:proton antiporter n=1 Tax=Actinomyces vulturis TaxID=1857645 RepID=UPI0008310385|nr:sodium:proton antiporter [Actinomyces vulturis]